MKYMARKEQRRKNKEVFDPLLGAYQFKQVYYHP